MTSPNPTTSTATPPPIVPAIERLWARLRGTRFVTVEVERGREGRNVGGSEGVDGVADGEVEWVNVKPDEVTWRERGRWTIGPLSGTRFCSAYAWRRTDAGVLSIAHLRLGPDHPVELVDLTESPDGCWRSADPHLCAEDRYSAEVRLVGRKVEVKWTVSGPTTGYLLTATYSATPSI